VTQIPSIDIAQLDRSLAVSVGPTVIVVSEPSSIGGVAQHLLKGADRAGRSATSIEAPATALALEKQVRRARSKVLIVHGLEHFAEAEWRHLDQDRSWLERDPPVLFILSQPAAERLMRHAPNLASWVGAMLRRLEGGPGSTPVEDVEAQREFDRLAAEWLRDTQFTSSITRMVKHAAYQQIIAMGERAIPPILRDLSQDPKHWGPALHAITGARPVPAEDAGKLKAVANAWLQWARDNGYRW
jgi:hypothetical protein